MQPQEGHVYQVDETVYHVQKVALHMGREMRVIAVSHPVNKPDNMSGWDIIKVSDPRWNDAREADIPFYRHPQFA